MSISCGVDIIEIDRVKRAVEQSGKAFLERVFTSGEMEYCENRGASKFLSYAARFAAKEAVSKAFGTGISNGLRWQDIEVVNSLLGAPEVTLHNKAAEIAQERGVTGISLSLSHCESHATAFVVFQIKD